MTEAPRYQPIAGPEELGNGGRIQWVSGRPGEAPAYAGTISSLPGMAGLPPFISFSTSYPELDTTVLRHMDNERFVGQPHTIQVHTADDFRIGRQPTTIVTWAELDFLRLALNPGKGAGIAR